MRQPGRPGGRHRRPPAAAAPADDLHLPGAVPAAAAAGVPRLRGDDDDAVPAAARGRSTPPGSTSACCSPPAPGSPLPRPGRRWPRRWRCSSRSSRRTSARRRARRPRAAAGPAGRGARARRPARASRCGRRSATSWRSGRRQQAAASVSRRAARRRRPGSGSAGPRRPAARTPGRPGAASRPGRRPRRRDARDRSPRPASHPGLIRISLLGTTRSCRPLPRVDPMERSPAVEHVAQLGARAPVRRRLLAGRAPSRSAPCSCRPPTYWQAPASAFLIGLLLTVPLAWRRRAPVPAAAVVVGRRPARRSLTAATVPRRRRRRAGHDLRARRLRAALGVAAAGSPLGLFGAAPRGAPLLLDGRLRRPRADGAGAIGIAVVAAWALGDLRRARLQRSTRSRSGPACWSSSGTRRCGWPRPPSGPGSPASCTTSSPTPCRSSSRRPTAAGTPGRPTRRRPPARWRRSPRPAGRRSPTCARCSACCGRAAARSTRPQPDVAAIPALVEDVRASGLDVDLIVEGEPQPLPAGPQLAAYRIVQESLTNVLKHAGPARRAWVRLQWRPDALELSVLDDGRGASAAMVDVRRRRARACAACASAPQLHGGRLDAGPRHRRRLRRARRAPLRCRGDERADPGRPRRRPADGPRRVPDGHRLPARPDRRRRGRRRRGRGRSCCSGRAADVVLMDVRMPGTDGIEATRQVTALPEPPRVVVLTTFDLDEYVVAAIGAGASGFLLKDAAARGDARRGAHRARRRLGDRGQLHPPAAAARRADAPRGGAVVAGGPTARAGRPDPARARGAGADGARARATPRSRGRFVVSEATVKTHVGRVLAKTGVARPRAGRRPRLPDRPGAARRPAPRRRPADLDLASFRYRKLAASDRGMTAGSDPGGIGRATKIALRSDAGRRPRPAA